MNSEVDRGKVIEREWNIYWDDKDKIGNAIYDFVSGIYRRLVAKNMLNHFIRKHLPDGLNVLHAGCGSGQVDVDIAKHLKITALDISGSALKIYKNLHGDNCKTVQGNIFNLPFADESFDGLYNLGVMEHFTEEEIFQILREFYRVLKPNGKVIVLWPPKNGFTTGILDFIHFVANRIFRMKIEYHPPEITRLTGKRQAAFFFENSGFSVIDYYFGAMDLFTHVVVVAQKSK